MSNFEDNEVQQLSRITDAYLHKERVFFASSLIVGILSTVMSVILVATMKKVQQNDFFLIKGNIYLLIGTLIRACCCFWLFAIWVRHNKWGDLTFSEPEVFSALATEFGLDLPLYFILMVMFSLLFSTYKLYLMIQEMLGLNKTQETEMTEAQNY